MTRLVDQSRERDRPPAWGRDPAWEADRGWDLALAAAQVPVGVWAPVEAWGPAVNPDPEVAWVPAPGLARVEAEAAGEGSRSLVRLSQSLRQERFALFLPQAHDYPDRIPTFCREERLRIEVVLCTHGVFYRGAGNPFQGAASEEIVLVSPSPKTISTEALKARAR
jgi:hypothetical protein